MALISEKVPLDLSVSIHYNWPSWGKEVVEGRSADARLLGRQADAPVVRVSASRLSPADVAISYKTRGCRTSFSKENGNLIPSTILVLPTSSAGVAATRTACALSDFLSDHPSGACVRSPEWEPCQ